jgi:hypothetical protein
VYFHASGLSSSTSAFSRYLHQQIALVFGGVPELDARRVVIEAARIDRMDDFVAKQNLGC